MIALLIGCTGGVTEPTTTPTADTGCTLLEGFLDADGDGHGDAASPVQGCELPPDAVAVGDDCDDHRKVVHPGAEETCDGADDDCDGSPGPDEVDADEDGVSVCGGDCDDADGARHPDADEVCDGIDNDCDEQLDYEDGSVDLFTCGYCPDTTLWPTATFERRTLNPCVLDPTVSLCSQFPVQFPDTNTQGNRLHRMIWRTDGHPLRRELLLFLPPGPGTHNEMIMNWAAYSGYRMISLGWQNEPMVENCPDSQCFDDVRLEMLYGEDHSGYLDIWPSDSVMGRTETLLAYLVRTYPGEGWDAYWDAVGGIHWDQIVVMGWSTGTGEAGYLGMLHEARSQVLISGPMDVVVGTVEAAEWMGRPRATPACQQWAMYHREETGALNPYPVPDLFPMTLGMLGIPGPPVDADSTLPPYGGSRMLNTEKEQYDADWCSPHEAMAMDECMHPDLSAMYTYAYCEAGGHLTCP